MINMSVPINIVLRPGLVLPSGSVARARLELAISLPQHPSGSAEITLHAWYGVSQGPGASGMQTVSVSCSVTAQLVTLKAWTGGWSGIGGNS